MGRSGSTSQAARRSAAGWVVSAHFVTFMLAAAPAMAQQPQTLGPGNVPIPIQVGRRAAPIVPDAGVETCTTNQECAERQGYGHVCVAGECQPYVDRTDIMEAIGMKSKSTAPPEPYHLYLAALPVIGYAPANGVVVGATGTAAMYLGNPRTTTISSLTVNAYYTAKSQVILTGSLTGMTADNEWELQGDYRFLIFNQETYGLSTGTAAAFNGFTIGGSVNTDTNANAQPMDFNLFRFNQSILKKTVGYLYLGGSFRFNTYWAIDDESLNVTSTPPVITSHYAYSQITGFNTTTYTLSGVSFDMLYDSRDSTINPYRGVYASLSFGENPTWLGSSQASSLFGAQFRAYLGLSDAVPRNVIAFWFYGKGVTSGNIPYLALPSIGWDRQGTTGRGYIQGRFRGTSELYAEAEWRFCLTNSGLLGGVVFVNAETFSRPDATYLGTSNPAVPLFAYVRPAGGFGLRIGMNREARINLRIDFAFGYNSGGVFIGTGEAF